MFTFFLKTCHGFDSGVDIVDADSIGQIRDRKKEMEDKYLTVVEEHVDRLGEMAKNIQEELQIQDRMVDDLGNRIDVAQEHVTNVNTRMKVS